MDLSPGRMKSRWKKLRRDPAAFADDLPWPLARALAVAGLTGAARASDLLDRDSRALSKAWTRADVALRRTDEPGRYELFDAHGLSPDRLPPRIRISPSGRRLVACAFDKNAAFLSGAELDPARGGVVALGREVQFFRLYPIDGAEPAPQRLDVSPAGRGDLIRLAREAGADAAGALHRAWPSAERRSPEPAAAAYRAWIRRNEPGPADTPAIAAWIDTLPAHPVISILMPVRDPQTTHLRAAIVSVSRQIYPHWQLCIADDGSRSEEVREVLDAAAAADARVDLVRLGVSRGVAVATNAALERAAGDACLFLDHDDQLAPHALVLAAAAFAEDPGAAAVYSDEDTVDANGRRSAPLFKPEFDAERLLSQNYLNHAFAVRTGLLRTLGGVRDGVDGAQDHDLALRVAEAGAGPILHIPQVLYHWRVYPGGRTLSQRASAEIQAARLRVVSDALRRRGLDEAAAPGPRGYVERRPRLPDPAPSVLAIVPTRDRPALLRACAAGLLEQTRYPDLRLRIIDNGSHDPEALALLEELTGDPRVEVLREDAPFNFSTLVNRGAAGVGADLLLLLNDDVLVVEPGWLQPMAAFASRPDAGAVGARLHYPDGRIQHAGLVLGLGPQGIAGHEFRGQAGDLPGPQGRLLVTRKVSAVTAACLVVAREKFEAVGGFDESLAVAFNDVDFCLRLRDRGWRNLWTPQARLIHLESASRGSDAAPDQAARFAQEAEAMRDRWGEALKTDPCYSANLTLEDESFTPAAVSRWAPPWA
jgi:GT2 family glycosyltransferase